MAKAKETFVIMEASIKDDFCNYSYEVKSGVGIGDTHTVKGTGIIDDDLRKALSRFNAHLAVIDEVYKHSGIEVTDIDLLHNHELTMLYHLSAFKIKGGADNETIMLIGNKYSSSAGGRLEIKTLNIPLDNLSSYKWYNELKTASDKARNEVSLYKGGKYTPVKEEEEKEDRKQGKIFAGVAAGNDNDSFDDFENAKV